MGWWLLRLSAKVLALLRLSVIFFKEFDININKPGLYLGSSRDEISYSFDKF